MKTVQEKVRFFITPKDHVVPDKWSLYRRLAKKQISVDAQLKLEWIIFYHTTGGNNAKLTSYHFGVTRKTLHKWLARFDERSLSSLEELSRAPIHVRKRQIDITDRVRIINLRKKHLRYGKMKLVPLYTKQYGYTLSSWKIQKVIEEESLYPDKAKVTKQRNKRRQSQINQRKRITEFQRKLLINHLWHVDTVLLTMSIGGYRYLLTAIDETSKLAYARLYTTHSSKQATDFLNRLYYLTNGQINNIHSDNGSEFKKHFEMACTALNIPQYYSRVHTPKDNAVLERFNRTIQEEFVNAFDVDPIDVEDFNNKLLDWLIEYNNLRPHQTLAYLTPLEYITTHTLKEVSPMYSSSTGCCIYIIISYNSL